MVPFAGCEVAVVVMLLVHPGFAEQLVGSAIVSGGDPRQAVRATLSPSTGGWNRCSRSRLDP